MLRERQLNNKHKPLYNIDHELKEKPTTRSGAIVRTVPFGAKVPLPKPKAALGGTSKRPGIQAHA